MADLIDQRMEAQLESKLEAKIACISKLLDVVVKQNMLKAPKVMSESENSGGETDGNSSSISTSSLKSKRQKKN